MNMSEALKNEDHSSLEKTMTILQALKDVKIVIRNLSRTKEMYYNPINKKWVVNMIELEGGIVQFEIQTDAIKELLK